MSSGALHVVPRQTTLPPAISLAEALRRSREAGDARTGYVQDALAVDFTSASDDEVFGPQTTSRVDLPDPAAWAARLGQAILEVMTGSRTAPQIVRWTTPEVYAVVARRGALVARRRAQGRPLQRQRIQVLRVRVCEPANGVAEAAVILRQGSRVRAVAMRLVGQDGKWRVSALQVG
ncbi:MAG: Rv3235 family protein [Ornithinibacter sp.]